MITQPVLTITKEDLVRLIINSYKDLATPGYENFIPDHRTLEVHTGQRDEFINLTITLLPNPKT